MEKPPKNNNELRCTGHGQRPTAHARIKPMPEINHPPTALLLDADDTLWENNIHFERVIAQFVAALQQHGVAAPLVHETLWATERRNIARTGYGSRAFCQSLHEVASSLGVPSLEPAIAGWEQFIFEHPIELMPGVRDTVPLLHEQGYRLVLFTKGDPDEQLGKLRRSGLAPHFAAVEVVFEKTVETFGQALRRYDLPRERTWMVGNSPRSDINPAKRLGLGTVFIAYHTTWHHEIEEILPGPPPTLVLEQFGQLMAHLGPGPGQRR
jgi:putative hydrolase of the HAD superfamily